MISEDLLIVYYTYLASSEATAIYVGWWVTAVVSTTMIYSFASFKYNLREDLRIN